MRLESALTASREGLISHGSAISVIGDNVANTSTVGYKKSRTEFESMLSQAGAGDFEPSGGGSAVQKVRSIFSPGILEQTGRSLDAGVAGEGFFVLGSTTNQTTPSFYTRAGNFSMTSEGILTSNDGKPVLGYAGTATSGALSTLNLRKVATASTPTSSASIVGNLDVRAEGKASAPSETPASFNELAANSTTTQTVEVYDSLGNKQTIALYFTKLQETGKWKVQAFVDGGTNGGTAGVPKQIGSSELTFDSNGVMTAGGTFTAQTTFTGAAQSNIAFDISQMTQYAANSAQSGAVVDGIASGQIKSYEIRKNGAIIASLDNGSFAQVGTLALASFNNIDALQRSGANQFTYTGSADAVITAAPQTQGLGEVEGGSLERSSVDIATEFTDLVVLQRGYQGNSQVLNATSQLLQQTLQLIR